ncbi:MAG: deoxyguanosinetriphosphate triphosphohydrolase [Verrucomicrobiota bacterium]|jgi:dGTPase
MPCTREQLQERERRTLAPYAQLSAESRGRVHPEPSALWRTEYQRDRDRVIHSRAFRRLEYKTQVFLNGTGDHLRTRLTHTIEVAAIARNIARALNLNDDLAETIALAHDLGHPPFGHKGEEVLDKLMRQHGGFEHNRQSLRIVEELEEKYPSFRGLNLTWETREGLAKHHTPFDHPGRRRRFTPKSPSLEAQVANLSDELTYCSHDLDDGLEAGLLSERKLNREVKLWARAARAVKDQTANLPDETRRYFIIRCIIDQQVRDVVETTEAAILASGVRSADDVRLQPRPLVQHSPARRRLNLELRACLLQNLYSSPEVFEPNQRAGVMLGDLFYYYMEHPRQIGVSSQKRARRAGWLRAICDYLSGMTDRYAILEHKRLFGLKGER